MKPKMRRPSATAVIALIALVAAIGGGTATARSLISSRDVRNGSLTGVDIKDHTITARDLSRSLTGKRSSAVKGDKGDDGAAGADGAAGLAALVSAEDSKPAFPQQVNCRIELPSADPTNPFDAHEDQDDSGRASINLNEQTTLDMNRVLTVNNQVGDAGKANLELGCWQPKRTGKGDGVVITGIKILLQRIDSNTNLNP